MAVYERADGLDPKLVRFPNAAQATTGSSRRPDSAAASSTCTCGAPRWAGSRSRTRTRSARQLLVLPQRHRSCATRACSTAGPATPGGRDPFRGALRLPDDVLRRLAPDRVAARAPAPPSSRSPFSGLNFLFADGDRLYAYRLGLFDLHWLQRPGQLLVASERVTDEEWHTVQQDVLLVLDPDRSRGASRRAAVGDELLERAGVRRSTRSAHLRGEARGAVAAERARAAAADEFSRRFALLVNPASAAGRP